MVSEKRIWAAFFSLALIWGTSFLFIKIALETIKPLTLVTIRLFIGLIGLLVILYLRRDRMPARWSVWRQFTVLGAINTAIPFILISWSESGDSGIDSAVASVLNSTVPLFSVLISGIILRVEEVSFGRILGLLVGFIGVILMVSRGFGGGSGSLLAYIAVIVAAFMYAIGGAFARRHFYTTSPVLVAAGQIFCADILVVLPALALEIPGEQYITSTTLGALLWLGLLGTCIAYTLYFYVLNRWGATRTTLVTYLIPAVGVAAGVIILGEAIDWRLVAGGGLILSGVAFVNWRPKSKNIRAS